MDFLRVILYDWHWSGNTTEEISTRGVLTGTINSVNVGGSFHRNRLR